MEKVHFYVGRGKNPLHKIMEELNAAYQNNQKAILLVPDQYTLQGEQDILNYLNLPGFFDIQVLSPSRLCYRIFEQTGQDSRTPIDQLGKQIALSQALLKSEKQLHFYNRISRATGFSEKMVAEINHWKQEGFTPDSLTELIAKKGLSSALKAKLTDICTVWTQYENILQTQFIDGLEVIKDAVKRVTDNPLFKDFNLFVYGFDLISHDLILLLSALAPQCAQISLGIQGALRTAPDGQVFIPLWRSINRFSKHLDKENIPWKITTLPPDFSLFTSRDIYHLTTNLFAYPPKPYLEEPENLFLHYAPTPFDELHHVANQLISLHRQGIPWDQLGVLAGHLDGYSTLIYGVFKHYNIPFYIDTTLSAADHGLIRYLIHSIRAATKGYQSQDVVACLKSGYGPISNHQAHVLENYILAYGIKGQQWIKPFTKGPKDTLPEIEEIRLAFITPIIHFKQNLLKASDSTSSLKAIMTLLDHINAYKELLKQEKDLLALGLEHIVSQNRQVWQLILHILDQMHHLMAGKRIPAVHIASWLDSAFLSAQLRGLPPTKDTLFCGELGHSLPGNITSLFVLGLNDGLLSRETSTLLTDQEQFSIEKDPNSPVFLSGKDLVSLAHADLLRSFSLPGKSLYLSYPQANTQGQVLRPLAQIDRIVHQLFPKLVVTGGLTSKEEKPPLAPLPTMAAFGPYAKKQMELSKNGLVWNNLANNDKNMPGQWQNAFNTLYAHPSYQGQLRALLSAFLGKKQVSPLPSPLAKKLYGKEVLSVSRLETFAQCPYRHFVDHGLRPMKRQEWVYTPQEIGTFYHNALKNYGSQIAAHPSWPNITKNESNKMMEEALSPLKEAFSQGPLGENAQGFAQEKRYQTTLETAAWVYTTQAQHSHFRPLGNEVSFGFENSLLPPIFLSLSTGEKIMIRGTIDRIDLFEKEESLYLRVVDYKSSNQSLDPTALWWGIQLQLMLYLQAALSYTPAAFPAGAFYFHVNDPYVELENDLVDIAQEKIAGVLKLRGVSLADVEIHRYMDTQEQTRYVDNVFKTNGELQKNAKAFSLEQMQQLLAHSLELANNFANRIYQGDIAIEPFEYSKKSPCAYCDYKGICGIEPTNATLFTKKLPSLTMDDLRDYLAP